MKHGLTWDMFKFNFSEINKTVVGHSKVLITGRPNAFLSDNEHQWVLRGMRQSTDGMTPVPDWPTYLEVPIDPFSDDEIEGFLRNYLLTKIRKAGREPQDRHEKVIDARISSFRRLDAKDVLSRPVHLKIFADVVTRIESPIKAQNVFDLYEFAAEQTFAVEMSKSERRYISASTRSKILQDVA